MEQLDDRIVPAVWTNANGTGLWSDAMNWRGGLPNSFTGAVFDASWTNDTCTFDNTVQADNRVVAGISTSNNWTGRLSLTGGNSLTTSGFSWTSGSITQASLSDVLVISGGDSNVWSGGTINSGAGTVLSELRINNQTALKITESAQALGDAIIIGEDGEGGSTLEFKDQSSTLAVTNNAYIKLADYTSDGAVNNQLLFDTDVTAGGTVTKGLSTTSVDSFIDNNGTITRSNAGMYQIELPIRNNHTYESHTAILDLQSSLWVSGRSLNKKANSSVDQEDGTTILENGATLKCQNILIKAGQLQTYGDSNATITQQPGADVTCLTVQGGTIDISANNHTLYYGSLTVLGSMEWTGGTFEAYVNGATAQQQTQLIVQNSPVTLQTGAHLHMNVNGALTAGLSWTPFRYGVQRSGTLTFDSGASFMIAYDDTLGKINVTSR